MREGWREVTLGELVTKRDDFTPVEPEEEYVILGVQRSGWGFVERKPILGREQKFTKLIKVEQDNLVYRTITAFEAPSAVVGEAEDDLYVTPQTFPVFRIDTAQLLPSYMKLLTTWPIFHQEMSARCTGTVLRRKTLSVKAFNSIVLQLPPLDEQRRIVDLIGSVDDAIETVNGSSPILERMWWSLASEIELSPSITDTRLLGDISDIHGGLTKNKMDAERSDTTDAPYLRVANVTRRRLILDEVSTITTSAERIRRAQLQDGDLLMTEGGDRDKLGRGAVWRNQIPGCTHQNHLFRVHITDPGFVPEFVMAWTNSFGRMWFDIHAAQTTGIASISKSTLSKFPVPVLSLEEQARWAALLDEVTGSEDCLITYADHLRTLRSNLLSALLSGEHEIPESYDEVLEEAAS